MAEVQPRPGEILRMTADVVAAEDIGAGDQSEDDEPEDNSTSYPRQRPSSRSRVTG